MSSSELSTLPTGDSLPPDETSTVGSIPDVPPNGGGTGGGSGAIVPAIISMITGEKCGKDDMNTFYGWCAENISAAPKIVDTVCEGIMSPGLACKTKASITNTYVKFEQECFPGHGINEQTSALDEETLNTITGHCKAVLSPSLPIWAFVLIILLILGALGGSFYLFWKFWLKKRVVPRDKLSDMGASTLESHWTASPYSSTSVIGSTAGSNKNFSSSALPKNTSQLNSSSKPPSQNGTAFNSTSKNPSYTSMNNNSLSKHPYGSQKIGSVSQARGSNSGSRSKIRASLTGASGRLPSNASNAFGASASAKTLPSASMKPSIIGNSKQNMSVGSVGSRSNSSSKK